MCQLRTYEKNCGDMLELVRYLKQELAKAVGSEYEVLSADQVLKSEKNRHKELGKYTEAVSHSMTMQSKKNVYFNAHVWGL